MSTLRGASLVVTGVSALVVLSTMPGLVGSYHLFLATQVLAFSTAALGLTVLLGWSGQIALAHAGFFGVGAYGTAYLHGQGLPWFAAVILAGLVATVLGVVIGLPAVRLRGFYLAIATLAFGELLVRGFVVAEPITHGTSGMSVTPLTIPGLDHAAALWYVGLSIFLISASVLWFVGRGRLGRTFRAVRDAEVATAALGIVGWHHKLLAFAVSAFLGALGGGVYGQLVSFLTPEVFGTALLIQFLVISLVGGVDTLRGAVIGAVFLIVGREFLQDLGSWQRFAFGAAIVIVVRCAPRGLASLQTVLLERLDGRRGTSTSDPRRTEAADARHDESPAAKAIS